MKKVTLLLVLMLLFFNKGNAQLINLNPDPSGDPWIAGGLPVVTPEIQAELDAIPEMQLSPASAAVNLPAVVDNSQEIFMRPIFLQTNGACGQASGVAYNYTYEINCLRNLPANDTAFTDNLYPTHYTYNFLNEGNPYVGSWYYKGWDIIMENGCPNITSWGGLAGDYRRWITGYSNYYSGMHNKIDSIWAIYVGSPAGLELFKHWIKHHNAGDSTGGLGCFSIYMGGVVYDNLPPESAEPDKMAMVDWNSDSTGFHAMTFVGYNDSIKYDLNNDGLFTNDLDINNDSVVNMEDWEIGALKVANSHGLTWPENDPYQDGYSYLPYRLLAKPDVIWDHEVHVLRAKETYSPSITVKATVDYCGRELLKFKVGYGENANVPSITAQHGTTFSCFHEQGGIWCMQGNNSDSIEIGLDFGHWYLKEDVGKIFLRISEFGDTLPNDGTINQFSIIDYRWNEIFELECEEPFPVVLAHNSSTTIAVDYDLIVPGDDQIIDQNVNLFSNMVSRFNPTVSNNASLTIEDSVEIDMYNSIIEIEEGASLIIGDNVVFTGKSGQNELLINGNIQIGKNVQFINIDNIFLNNENQQITINNAVFNQSFLLNKSPGLSINKCTFSSCDVLWSTRGNLTIDSSDFYCTWLLIDNLFGSASDVATITSNNISGYQNCPAGIYISDYDKFLIARNSIDNCGSGIQIYESGWGVSGNQNVFDNEISNCSNKGLNIYNSRASIAENYIHGNDYGVWIARNSQIALVGNAAAYDYNETQQIKDNNSYELYASEFSFPWYCKYNVIIDNDNSGNPSDPLVYFDYTGIEKKDVNYNCWGTGFLATDDLYPVGGFDCDSIWCPPGTTIVNGLVEQLYFDAIDEYENENFAQAQQEFEYIIDNYPATKYAENAVRDLFSIEQFIDNDYASLIQYFENNDSIQNNIRLKKLAHFLSNRCNTKLEDWQLVIDHYEDIIENPETPADSIFAIIDLGYTYLLMEASGNKSYYQGKMTEYIPGSKTQFVDQKTYLLSLLPFTKESGDDINSESVPRTGELQQNIPNPFRNITSIPFKTFVDGSVTISVYNHTGGEVISQELGYISAGENIIQIELKDLPSGIYFYSLVVNGVDVDSKKMVLLK